VTQPAEVPTIADTESYPVVPPTFGLVFHVIVASLHEAAALQHKYVLDAVGGAKEYHLRVAEVTFAPGAMELRSALM